MKLFLVKHATTDWNLSGRIQGQTDIGLNSQGQIEAKQLAKLLSTFGIDIIISSDLKRAKETAEIINSVLQLPLQLEPRLRECSFGKIEGLTKQQAIDKYGASITPNWEDEYHAYDFRPFNGEHRDEVLARHLDAITSLANDNLDKVVLLVGHGRGICTLLAELGYPPDIKRGECRLIKFGDK